MFLMLLQKFLGKKQLGKTFLHYHSCTPLSAKKANVTNLLKFFNTIREFNNEQNKPGGIDTDNNIKELQNLLLNNAYPTKLINEWIGEHKVWLSNVAKNEIHYNDYNYFCESIKSARVDVMGDGHCLLHCVSQASGKRYGNILATLSNQISANAIKFKSYLPPNWKQQMKDYIDRKIWHQDLTDILPMILAESITKQINIISEAASKTLISTFGKRGECNTNEGTLYQILQNGHFNWLDTTKLAPDISKWLNEKTEKSNDGNKETCEYRRPTIVLPYKSEVATTKIIQAKNKLSIKGEFNITFRTTARLCDLTMKLNQRVNREHNCERSTAQNEPGVIYMLKCKTCESQGTISKYIGETGRVLDIRLKEHFKEVKEDLIGRAGTSAVGEHSLITHGTQPKAELWDVEILDHQVKTQDRKFMEAKMIHECKPTVNRDNGTLIILSDTKF
jgi:hypothetical protein